MEIQNNIFLMLIIYLVIKYFKFIILIYNIILKNNTYGDWGLGIGDWGLGIGDLAQNPIPKNPKPQTQTPKKF